MTKENIRTLQDLLAKSAELYGDKAFLKEKKGREVIETSFSQLCEKAKRVGSFIMLQREAYRWFLNSMCPGTVPY